MQLFNVYLNTPVYLASFVHIFIVNFSAPVHQANSRQVLRGYFNRPDCVISGVQVFSVFMYFIRPAHLARVGQV